MGSIVGPLVFGNSQLIQVGQLGEAYRNPCPRPINSNLSQLARFHSKMASMNCERAMVKGPCVKPNRPMMASLCKIRYIFPRARASSSAKMKQPSLDTRQTLHLILTRWYLGRLGWMMGQPSSEPASLAPALHQQGVASLLQQLRPDENAFVILDSWG